METYPIHSYENETKALYCSVHKEDGMHNVKSQMCAHEGCKMHSNFNYENDTNALFCRYGRWNSGSEKGVHTKHVKRALALVTKIRQTPKLKFYIVRYYNYENKTKVLCCSVIVQFFILFFIFYSCEILPLPTSQLPLSPSLSVCPPHRTHPLMFSRNT